MEVDVRQSRLFQQYLHPVVGGAWPHRFLRCQRIRKDPLADGMFLPLLQTLDGAGRETDSAPAPFRFSFADLQLPSLGGIHRAEDLQRSGTCIEVLPHEAADLTPGADWWSAPCRRSPARSRSCPLPPGRRPSAPGPEPAWACSCSWAAWFRPWDCRG